MFVYVITALLWAFVGGAAISGLWLLAKMAGAIFEFNVPGSISLLLLTFFICAVGAVAVISFTLGD